MGRKIIDDTNIKEYVMDFAKRFLQSHKDYEIQLDMDTNLLEFVEHKGNCDRVFMALDATDLLLQCAIVAIAHVKGFQPIEN